MPIIQNDASLFIAHPIAGLGSHAAKLGHMSLEFAMWLNLRRQYERVNPELSNRPLQPSPNPNIYNHTTRCMLAGYRHYKPQVCSQIGQLTSYGNELADIAHDWSLEMIELNRASETNLPIAHKPETLRRAEDIFLSADISISTLRFLAMMLEATRQVESAATQTNLDISSREHQLRILDFFNKEQQKAKEVRKAEGRTILSEDESIEVNLDRLRQASLGSPLSPYDRNGHDGTNIPIQAICLATRDAYVPTTAFTNRARSALRTLTKFGLVDTRVFSTGHRGRPPNVVRPSVTGSVLIDDLRKREFI